MWRTDHKAEHGLTSGGPRTSHPLPFLGWASPGSPPGEDGARLQARAAPAAGGASEVSGQKGQTAWYEAPGRRAGTCRGCSKDVHLGHGPRVMGSASPVTCLMGPIGMHLTLVFAGRFSEQVALERRLVHSSDAERGLRSVHLGEEEDTVQEG